MSNKEGTVNVNGEMIIPITTEKIGGIVINDDLTPLENIGCKIIESKIEERVKVLYFPADIEEEETQAFITSLSEAVNEFDKIIIYYMSNGGSFVDASKVIDFINRYPDKIEIVGQFDIASAAVDVLLRVNCKVKLMEDTFFTLHIGSIDFPYRELKKGEQKVKYMHEYLKKDNEKQIKYYAEQFVLTEKEVNLLHKGEDLYLEYDRIKWIQDKYDKYVVNRLFGEKEK